MEGDRRRRATSRDNRTVLPRNTNHDDDEEPIFPLDKETMMSFLPTVSALSLVCISSANLTCFQFQNRDDSTNPHLTTILASLPYAFLPFGLAGLAAATAAKTKTHLVGCGSGCLLGEFMYCLIVTGLIMAAPPGDEPWVVVVVGVVTLVMLVATVLGWSYACSYPKFLRCIWINAIWINAGRSQKQSCPSCTAAETSAVSPTAEGFTDLCLTCGASRGDTRRVRTSGGGADEAAAAEVVTKPVIAHLITLCSVIFSVAVIGMFAYIVYLHFKIDGPLWAAVLSCAAESPLFLVPLCMVPKLRDAFVSVYVTGLPDSSSSDLNTRLLASESV